MSTSFFSIHSEWLFSVMIYNDQAVHISNRNENRDALINWQRGFEWYAWWTAHEPIAIGIGTKILDTFDITICFIGESDLCAKYIKNEPR